MSTTRLKPGRAEGQVEGAAGVPLPIEGAVEVPLPLPMFGQLLELPPGAVEWRGAVVVELPLVDVDVDVDDDAAFAIAAPPPANAQVTANVTRSGFSRTSPPLLRPHQTVLPKDVSSVGGE